jgi:hypothetical protein
MDYSSFAFIKVQVIERAVPWLASRLRGNQMTSRSEQRVVADAFAGLPEIKFDLSFLEVPEIKFDLSFLDRRELADGTEAEVGGLHMRYHARRQERDLEEGFRERAAEVARRAAKRDREGVRGTVRNFV